MISDFDVDDKRVVIYSSEEQLQALSKSKVLYMDGTFASAPGRFKQIFVIMGEVGL